MIKALILILGVLLGVAFMTLVERKILGFMQLRKGPNLVGMWGVMQPFSDGLKIVSKKTTFPLTGTLKVLLAPLMFFFLSLFIWMPLHIGGGLIILYGFIFLLCVSSLGAFLVFFSGWGGGSVFSFLGGIRASAQMISYEVILSFIIVMPFIFFFSFSFESFLSPTMLSGWFAVSFLSPILMTAILAETSRAPFDLTEGESELVSGFNTEYSSTPFVLLFLGEYSLILIFSYLLSIILCSNAGVMMGTAVGILWIRACFPRKRYDSLMSLMWVLLFPVVCLTLMIISGMVGA